MEFDTFDKGITIKNEFVILNEEKRMACDYKKALDLAKSGKWDAAHETVQPYSDPFSCRIHGYLHRVEGDLSNAGYWYNRAGIRMPNNSLEDELNLLYEKLDSVPASQPK